MQNVTKSTASLAAKTTTVCRGSGSGESRTEVLKDVNFEARMGELLMLVGQTAMAYLRGDTTEPIGLRFVRIEPYVVPKVSLTCARTARVDTRVLQVSYSFERPQNRPVYVGRRVDLFVKSEVPSIAARMKSPQKLAQKGNL